MELNNYNILLRSLEFRDIEMVRLWRNSSFVREYMEFRDNITIELQRKWYEALGNNNYYFIIYHNNYPIGLTYIKNTRDDIGYFGIFIADEESLNTLPMISYKTMISMLDFAFYELKLKLVEATILYTNPRAMRFNESVGFKLIKENGTEIKQYYLLKEDNYAIKSKKIKKILLR